MSDFKGMGTVHHLAPQPGAKPRARILVVDDNLDTVHSMALLIKAFGNEVDFAISGFAAIAAARKFRPDVILLDINLPDFKGDKLAQQLKYEPGLENVRIIALSGNSDEGTKARAIEAGCEAYHVKPLEPALLEELLTKT